MIPRDVQTWIEIDKSALYGNVRQFLRLISRRTNFMAVVKSNAYGHGLTLIAKQLANFQFPTFNFRKRLWFGVDSIVEALGLRKEGIINPILVMGSTLPERMPEAFDSDIILTISNFESLKALAKLRNLPKFHLKIDTGMHRQGFLMDSAVNALRIIQNSQFKIQNSLTGIYTHFAAAKDPAYPTYTLEQFRKFKVVISYFEKAGFRNLIRHASASSSVLLFPETNLDMARIGMGIYGYFPSVESKITLEEKVTLRPVLTWKTVISEIKEIPAGSFVGYDLTERVKQKTQMAVLPAGYWHGYDRGLSSVGEVLIRGRRAKILGRVSMNMTVVDVTGIKQVRVGDEAVLVGRSYKNFLGADDQALKIGTSPYEFLVRINPLIKRVLR